jgi:hypothetical protein
MYLLLASLHQLILSALRQSGMFLVKNSIESYYIVVR